MESYKQVLDFWFSSRVQPLWFVKKTDFDSEIIEKFKMIHNLATSGMLSKWQVDVNGCLALVIVLDQFSRNIFRDQKEAFAYDEQARSISEQVIYRGDDELLDMKGRVFLYMPFMHSESLIDQERSIDLYRNLGMDVNLNFAIEHRDIIARFGRFPHRNKILERNSTDAETLFLENEHSGF